MKTLFHRIELFEDKYYLVWIYHTNKNIYIFKKVSEKGYNFINPINNKCFFKKNMYMDKKSKKFILSCSINVDENLNDANTKNSKLILRTLKIKKFIKNENTWVLFVILDYLYYLCI